MLVNESNVVNGKNHLGAVSSPFWTGERREMNVACYVQDVRFDAASLQDDFQSIPPAFAEVRCFDPLRFGFLRPGIGNLLKRLLDAEVAEGAFFAEEPHFLDFAIPLSVHFIASYTYGMESHMNSHMQCTDNK